MLLATLKARQALDLFFHCSASRAKWRIPSAVTRMACGVKVTNSQRWVTAPGSIGAFGGEMVPRVSA